jgi:hypothetical protein
MASLPRVFRPRTFQEEPNVKFAHTVHARALYTSQTVQLGHAV